MVITMGCHLRYLNHSLFNCFVYYTRLLLGFPRPVLTCAVASIAFLSLVASSTREKQLVLECPDNHLLSHLSWTSNRMPPGVLPLQIERL